MAKKKEEEGEFTEEALKEDNKDLKAFETIRTDTDDKLDFGFYAVLCFQSHKQKMEFLGSLPDKIETFEKTYVDGQTLAQYLGIEITPNGNKPMLDRLNKKRVERVTEFKEARAKLN